MAEAAAAPRPDAAPVAPAFTPYQKLVVAMLTFLQFTIVMDFQIMSPLGPFVMPALGIGTREFGLAVSAYAFSAGASGFLAAGYADRFDRKKLLLFFYAGFVLGTLLCGLAPNYPFLIAARIVTGIFGGVIGSITFAITTDLFPLAQRGRVMGLVMTAFSASQVLGIPAGLYLSNAFGWHAPFVAIVVVSIVPGVLIWQRLEPITGHLALPRPKSAFGHLAATLTKGRYVQAYATTALLATGGFMIMPFSTAFNVHNVGIPMETLPLVSMITGVVSIIGMPWIGRLADRVGRFRLFAMGSVLAAATVIGYTHLGHTPLLVLVGVNVLMFVGISSRAIPAQALMSAVPDPASRGAFMSVNSSLQQVSGGVAAALAGLIVVARPDGGLERFDLLGWLVVAAFAVTTVMMYRMTRLVGQG